MPFSTRTAGGKRDAGLYAMNHGDVYVASVAVYASYAQVLQALAEADRYPGAALVLAYLPYAAADAPALAVLQEAKRAVDAGYAESWACVAVRDRVYGGEGVRGSVSCVGSSSSSPASSSISSSSLPASLPA